MTPWPFGRDQKGPREIPFCPIKPSNEQYISEGNYRNRRDAATEAELGRLKATPEYRQWAARKRRDRVTKALTSATTLRVVTMLVLAGAAFWAGQITPPGALPELLQSTLTPAAQPDSELLLQLETERILAQSYGARVEQLSAKIAALQVEHSSTLQQQRTRHQEQLLQREKQLKSLEAKAAAAKKTVETEVAVGKKAAAAKQEQADRASAKALADAQAQVAQMRVELERLQKKLTRAQEVNPPASVLSATNLSIILLLLVATSAATFWLSFQRYTKEQLQEIEDLRLEAEAREAKLIQEKSMIGRLQKELVRVNSEMGELDGQLERMKRAEAEAERLQKRVTELEGASKGTDAGLASANSKVAKLSARLKEREEQLSEAQDCYAKLESLHHAEKADSATTLATALATKESELKAAHAGELAQRAQQIGELLAKLDEVQAHCEEEVKTLKATADKLQSQHEQQVMQLKAEADKVRGQHGKDVRKLEAEAEKLRGQYEQELQAVKGKLEETQAKTGEMQAQHEQEAEKLASEIEKLRKQEELSSILVKAMQNKLDEHEHAKAENEGEIKRLTDLVNLEKDTVLVLQQTLQEAREGLGNTSDGEPSAALALTGDLEGDVQQHMALALADRDSFYKERARALSVMHSELEDKHSDTRRSLRENEDMVRSLQTNVRQLECEADRHNADLNQYQQEVDDLKAQLTEQQAQLSQQHQDQQNSENSHIVTIREFERQLADAQSEVQRLERENENLEGQVEQLAISLMDATSKKTDSELRLRQLQQDLLEMEMLMSRAEQERVALERELRAMRATAGEAISHLHLAEEELRRESSNGSPDSPGMDAQGRSNGSLDSMGPIQTPISTALGLMQKMEGVARLLGGSETPSYSSPASKGPISQRPSPADGLALSRPHSSLRGARDETARTIEFAPLTSSSLGRLQEEGAKEEGSAPASPAGSPLRMAQQTVALLDEASAAAEARMDQTAQMALALQQQVDLLDSLKVSEDNRGLSALQATMHDAYRALASDTAALKEAKEAAVGAAHTAQSADDAFAAAQEAVQHLSEERATAEERFCAAMAHADECTVALASASAECNAAEDNLKEFEPKGLGSFGGGAESKEAWRRRVAAQDTYTSATEAKAAALATKEEALLAKRAVLARQEAAVLVVAAQEGEASAAAEAAQDALKELETRAKAVQDTHTAFLEAKAAFCAELAKISPGMHLAGSAAAKGSCAMCNNPRKENTDIENHYDVSAASKAEADQTRQSAATVRLTADSHASSASLLAKQASPGVSPISESSDDGSPGSVENQPQQANLRADRFAPKGSFKGLLSSLSFNKRLGMGGVQSRPDVGALRAKSESSAVLGERRHSTNGNFGSNGGYDGNSANAEGSIRGTRRSTDALSLLDTAWFSHSGAYD